MEWMIMEWYFITTVMIDSNVSPNCNSSGVISEYVNPYIPTQEVTICEHQADSPLYVWPGV